MAKPGDTVRYLNAVGGGVVTRIEGKIAYVDDNGFETPVLLKELVVVLPAGHEPEIKGSQLMFDQTAFDKGKNQSISDKTDKKIKKENDDDQNILPVETEYGDNVNILLAFEPTNLKNLSQSQFSAVLVNDSNYFASISFMGKKNDSREWNLIYQGIIAPNELTDMSVFSHDNVGDIETIAIQAILFKKNKGFILKSPLSVERRLDLTKFYKLHCFRKSRYFDESVIEIPLISGDKVHKSIIPDADSIERALKEKITADISKPNKEKRVDNNPHKLLPLIEIDLHIHELTDSISGLRPSDMLQMQLDKVRNIMKQHSKRIGQKIVFIHGKGEGVLRNAVLSLLRKEYPKATTQDASFREYGFGATLVTIH